VGAAALAMLAHRLRAAVRGAAADLVWYRICAALADGGAASRASDGRDEAGIERS
jgi:hypothetical protein